MLRIKKKRCKYLKKKRDVNNNKRQTSVHEDHRETKKKALVKGRYRMNLL